MGMSCFKSAFLWERRRIAPYLQYSFKMRMVVGRPDCSRKHQHQCTWCSETWFGTRTNFPKVVFRLRSDDNFTRCGIQAVCWSKISCGALLLAIRLDLCCLAEQAKQTASALCWLARRLLFVERNAFDTLTASKTLKPCCSVL